MHFPSLIVNTLIAVHGAVSFTLQGCGLFAHARHLLWHFIHQLLTPCRARPETLDFLRCALHVTPEPFQKYSSDSWPRNAIHSCGRLSLSPAFLSAPPGWEAVNTTTAERENHSFPPTPLYQCTPSSHRTNPGQTAIKTSAPPAKGWVRVNHRSINLIFIHSPLAASHRWAGSGGVDCVDCHARCNYTHLCLWVALHMTGKNWVVILAILSLMKELAQ